jgi:dethiobiotin synthetase
MRPISIAGAGTDIGKTYVAAALIRTLIKDGIALDAFKPVVSGIDDDAPEGSDPARLLTALGRPLNRQTLDVMSPLRFRAPLSPPSAARLEGKTLAFDDIATLCRSRADEPGDALLLIETAGGVMSPLDDSHTMLDLMADLDAPVILVGGSYLGSISHTLTALDCLWSRDLDVLAIVISESEGDHPDFAETVQTIAGFAGDVPVLPCPRTPDAGWDASALAVHVATQVIDTENHSH